MAGLAAALTPPAGAESPEDDAAMWTIYVTNDNCPDYTWGFAEERTRRNFAEIVRAHLDEMKRTDQAAPPDRDRYNMAVTQEALCFLERYPQRRDELIARVKEGRVYVSPYLCNTLWAFQSLEGAVRSFYPARRLERRWGVPMVVAEHIEQPSLPWGAASILAGCGVRWLSVPFLNYDSTTAGMKNPPLFIFEGPDGGKVRVVMDRWASGKASYTQGSHLLGDPEAIAGKWLPHYRRLGKGYPLRAVLASGTHGDITPKSGDQARGFADAIMRYNARPRAHPKLVNAILPQFCAAVDQVQAKRPFMQTLRGCFGHSWDLWPVCMARYVADMRRGERMLLAAEALLAIAARSRPELHRSTTADRRRAEWCWTMLADHAWNGTDERNKRHNADLRRRWSKELNQLSSKLLQQGWTGAGLAPGDRHVAVFNALSVPRAGLVRVEPPPGVAAVTDGKKHLPCQVLTEGGRRALYFVAPEVKGFGLKQLALKQKSEFSLKNDKLRATQTELEGPYYRLGVDGRTGGLASLVHKPSGTEILAPRTGRSLCQTVYFDGEERTLTDVKSERLACGPVLARLRIRGKAAGLAVINLVTLYADLDRVDFDLRIRKQPAAGQERLCQVFPVLRGGEVLRIETTGAVIRPRPQPKGDLLAGADTRRFAVQGFVDASLPRGPGVTIAPLDAFALRSDLGQITFEALGNDQNHREVVLDQHGVRTFRFRYSLRVHRGGYSGPAAFAWSRSVASPLLAAMGRLAGPEGGWPGIVVDPGRAIATCLKPADEDAPAGCILRLWEVAGKAGPLTVQLRGYRRAVRTDLLERDLERLPITAGRVAVQVRPHGFAAVRLLP